MFRGAVVACVFLGFVAQSGGLLAIDAQIHFVPPGSRVEDLPKLLPPKPGAVADEVADAGDFYNAPGGRKVGLLRVKNSVAVRFNAKTTAQKGMAALKARAGLAAHDEVACAQFRNGGALHLLRAKNKGAKLDAKAFRADGSVAFSSPVYFDPKTRSRMIPTEEILVRFAPGADPAAAAKTAGLDVMGRSGDAVLNVFRLRMRDPKSGDPLQLARSLSAARGVVWAQPNFVREIHHFLEPGNALFADQQALRNTGQNNASPGADVDAMHAWDTTTGVAGIVIAIIDDGVDRSHPGLRIFTKPPASLEDASGLIDDVHGWDFANDDNDPSPVGTNGHGTGCAGIAAAKFGSRARTAGIAPGCTILPVKIADDTGEFTTDEKIAKAILYAAHYADVLSNSWGGGSPSQFIDDAIMFATTNGRGGKGCPVFFATGNSASTWYQGGGRYRLSTQGLKGNYYYSFFYEKGATSGGENAVRIDNVCLLDADGYTHKTAVLPDEDFEFFVFGWWLANGGGATGNWSLSTENALTGTGGYFSAVSPTLAKDQYAWLITPLLSIAGNETFAFAGSVSIPDDSFFYVPVYNENGVFVGAYGPWNGVPDAPTPETGYPASAPGAIAVGAATDAGFRSDYSEYAGKLDFVAPSNGGWNDIATLDPVGVIGWTPGDFKMNFGGTSAATPLAAGIAALVLSVNPSLTATEIRDLLRRSTDQIGGVIYGVNGTHPEYGFGRLNARKAVENALAMSGAESLTIDTDGDGLPDFWERANALNASDPLDAARDDDGDGFTNLQEYLAGTDPSDSSSRFIAAMRTSANGDVHLAFPTLVARSYRVEYAEQLGNADWRLLGGDIAGTGAVVDVIDSGAIRSQSARYYRVRVQP